MEIITIFALVVMACLAYRMVITYTYLRKVVAVARFLPEAVPLLVQTSTMIFISGTAAILSIGVYAADMLEGVNFVYKMADVFVMFVSIALCALAETTRSQERDQLKHAIATHAAQAA